RGSDRGQSDRQCGCSSGRRRSDLRGDLQPDRLATGSPLAGDGAAHELLIGGFKGFTGNNGTSGPNDVVTSGHCLFVTDAPSRVVSFNTSTFPPTMVSAVSTASGDLNRADELAFDP